MGMFAPTYLRHQLLAAVSKGDIAKANQLVAQDTPSLFELQRAIEIELDNAARPNVVAALLDLPSLHREGASYTRMLGEIFEKAIAEDKTDAFRDIITPTPTSVSHRILGT